MHEHLHWLCTSFATLCAGAFQPGDVRELNVFNILVHRLEQPLTALSHHASPKDSELSFRKPDLYTPVRESSVVLTRTSSSPDDPDDPQNLENVFPATVNTGPSEHGTGGGLGTTVLFRSLPGRSC